MLRLEEITKQFEDVLAVDSVSFTVEPGRIFGFLGPNGAGKTTAIRIIMDILKADMGRVIYDGSPEKPDASAFGYLPEERGLYQKIPVKELLIYFASLRGKKAHEAGMVIDNYLERFDLSSRYNTKVSELSKGNQQKVQFINAIVHDPRFLILDEPFSGLDPVNQIILKEILAELKAQEKTIILSSHQMDQVEKICDDIGLVNKGKLIVSGDLKQIKQQHGKQVLEVMPLEAAQLQHDLFREMSGEVQGNGNIHIPFQSESEVQGMIGKINAVIPTRSIRIAEAGLEEIFISLVRGVK
ncbi:MAG: ATP-binding cassette domain-containing protein [Lentisphaeria bacterium]|nr:ATP-binding cassette domain-containing protein [Candidatus Neomarinimicrobiota bacterium]MCF7842992.1 ATP-binding cassette domain-containing protein [Lentisphaeria bacterium]